MKNSKLLKHIRHFISVKLEHPSENEWWFDRLDNLIQFHEKIENKEILLTHVLPVDKKAEDELEEYIRNHTKKWWHPPKSEEVK